MGKNAPAGADEDSRAPWNDRAEPEEREYDQYEDMEEDPEEED